LLLFLVFFKPVLFSGDFVFLPAVLDSAAGFDGLGVAGFAGAAAGFTVRGVDPLIGGAVFAAAVAFPAVSFFGGIRRKELGAFGQFINSVLAHVWYLPPLTSTPFVHAWPAT
jgi:hypothetical protein